MRAEGPKERVRTLRVQKQHHIWHRLCNVGLPYMDLLRLASEHIILSWTLLRAFGPHELLVSLSSTTPSRMLTSMSVAMGF